MMHQCKFCDCILASENSLLKHQKTAKKCLIKKGAPIPEGNFKCDVCDHTFIFKSVLSSHIISCTKKNSSKIKRKKNFEEENILLKSKLLELETKYNIDRKELETKYNMLLEEKKEWKIEQKKLLDKITNAAFGKTSDDDDEDNFDINDESNSEEYKLTPLELGDGYSIEHREEDGFINVTNLCKVAKKQFSDWNKLDETDYFIEVLSSSIGLPPNELIKYKKSSSDEKEIWTHPQVAIHIAQWISPRFDVKVSSWVYEAMMTGEIDITNTKSYKELQKENKNKDLKIQFLTKKYVKLQPRVQYDEKNVIYILTTKLMKKERRYILGKAVDLTSRLSTYNKSDEHEVIYFASCKDSETMNIV